MQSIKVQLVNCPIIDIACVRTEDYMVGSLSNLIQQFLVQSLIKTVHVLS